MAFTEQDIRAIVDDQILRRFGGKTNDNDIEFLTTAEAVRRLNYPSADSLRKAVKNEVLRVGYEVQDRRNDDSDRAVYYFNIPACIKRLNIPPEKRA